MRVFEAPPQTRDAILSKYRQAVLDNTGDEEAAVAFDNYFAAQQIESLDARYEAEALATTDQPWYYRSQFAQLRDILDELMGGALKEGLTEWMCYQVLPLDQFATQDFEYDQDRMMIWPEDKERAVETLTWYHEARKRSDVQNQMRKMFPDRSIKNPLEFSLYDLEDLMSAMTPETIKSAKNQRWKPEDRGIPPSHAKTVMDEDGWLIVEVNDAKVASDYAKGTRWCTSNKNTAQGYLDDGPLYVMFRNGQKYGQSHGSSNQIMNVQDRRIQNLESGPSNFLVRNEMNTVIKSLKAYEDVDLLRSKVVSEYRDDMQARVDQTRKQLSERTQKLDGLNMEDNPLADLIVSRLFPSFERSQVDAIRNRLKQEQKMLDDADAGTIPDLARRMDEARLQISNSFNSQLNSISNLIETSSYDKAIPPELVEILGRLMSNPDNQLTDRYGRSSVPDALVRRIIDQNPDFQDTYMEYLKINFANDRNNYSSRMVIANAFETAVANGIDVATDPRYSWMLEELQDDDRDWLHQLSPEGNPQLTEAMQRYDMMGPYLSNRKLASWVEGYERGSEGDWMDEQIRILGNDWLMANLNIDRLDEEQMERAQLKLESFLGKDAIISLFGKKVEIDTGNDELERVLKLLTLPDSKVTVRSALTRKLLVDSPIDWDSIPEDQAKQIMTRGTSNYSTYTSDQQEGFAVLAPDQYPLLSGRLYEFLVDADPEDTDISTRQLRHLVAEFSPYLVMPNDTKNLIFRQTNAAGDRARPPAIFGWSCSCCFMPIKWQDGHWRTQEIPVERINGILQGGSKGSGRGWHHSHGLFNHVFGRSTHHGQLSLDLSYPDAFLPQWFANRYSECFSMLYQLGTTVEGSRVTKPKSEAWSPHVINIGGAPNTLWCTSCWGVRAIGKDMSSNAIWEGLRSWVPCKCGFTKASLELYDAEEPTEAQITEEITGALGSGGPTGLNQTAYEAEYVAIPETDMDSFLTGMGFARVTVPRAKEIVYDRTYGRGPDGGTLVTRVYSSIAGGQARGAGKDAIRVVPIYVHPNLGDFPMARMKRVHRVTGWRNNLRDRINDSEARAPGPVLDSNGKPMVLRKNRQTGDHFWGSVDYPGNRETRPYRGG